MKELPDKKVEGKQTLKECVLGRIESTHIKPHSRWHFLYQESFMWSFWLLSIIVGAFATAVILYVMKHRHFAPYFATHDSFFWFVVDALPYIWFILLVLMVLIAVYNIKCTTRGYRHSLPTILFSSLAFSVVIGTVLQSLGFGFAVDRMLGTHMPLYISQQKFDERLWQSPLEGRLIGRQVLSTVAPTSTIVFEDIDGNRWNFCVSELSERERELLASKQMVRMVGTTTVSGAKIFHACGILTWATDNEPTMKRLGEERQEFITRAREHMMHKAAPAILEDRLVAIGMNDSYAVFNSTSTLCAETLMVKRLERMGQ